MTDAEKAQKKAALQNKKAFNLHVSLIEHQDEINVSDARAVAYREGPEGLKKRSNA